MQEFIPKPKGPVSPEVKRMQEDVTRLLVTINMFVSAKVPIDGAYEFRIEMLPEEMPAPLVLDFIRNAFLINGWGSMNLTPGTTRKANQDNTKHQTIGFVDVVLSFPVPTHAQEPTL